ncbi:arylalkylamine N-acetyltransferase 1-like [Aphidius gifuensis]|uniref:arylalkylamine N-acetyltransferase 1-like n=1 Tax=Aphidius gifuensis TaxID=684658 RepID=UPI001CDB7062|nr:arylalkylamine N-acetyltransferase 1-like [Aphidius gifuensis]
MKKELEQGLSLIAIEDNDKIVAAAINYELNSSIERAVDEDYQKTGIARKMAKRSMLLAKKRGHKLITADVTSKYMAKIMEKLGFTAIKINSKFEIRIADFSDNENILKFMKRTYLKTEPCLVSCGLSLKEPSPFMIDIMKKQLEQGLSLIVIGENDETIASLINYEFNSSTELEYYSNLSKLADDKIVKDLIDFEAYIATLSDVCQNYNVDKFFTISIIAVDEAYQQIGIARKMIERSIILAKQRGYKIIRADISSKYTAKILEKFGFTAVVSFPLKNYLNDQGELLFKNIIPPHDTFQIFIYRIDN